MRDVQELMKKFVKIIEKYPEVYDNSLDGYRSQQAELAWVKIVEQVKNDLKEECTVEELKAKWKGIRSSYNRYKNKLNVGTVVCKKYYLYDYLQFLDPFIKPRGISSHEQIGKNTENFCNYGRSELSNESESVNERDPLDDWEVDIKHDYTQNVEKDYKIDVLEISSPINNIKNVIGTRSMKMDGALTINESDSLNECNNSDDWDTDVKPSLIQKEETVRKTYNTEVPTPRNNSRRSMNIKTVKSPQDNASDVNEDLQFFKSILSDIKNFTTKEKRKLKMGILQLIDDVENERKRQKMSE